jgi:hypothetical protein
MSEHKIELKPITIADDGRRRNTGDVITLDKSRRLSLRLIVREKLAIEGRNAFVYISVDPANKVIGIVRQDAASALPGAKAMRVDKRGYTNGRAIYDKLALPIGGAPYYFEFIGEIDSGGAHWRAYRLAED